MPSNHFIHGHPLLFLPSIFPSITVFSKEQLGFCNIGISLLLSIIGQTRQMEKYIGHPVTTSKSISGWERLTVGQLDIEQQTGCKSGKECIKVVYRHPVYLTYMQNTSCEMLGWMKHKLESRNTGEISITSHMWMTPPLRKKVKKNWRVSW